MKRTLAHAAACNICSGTEFDAGPAGRNASTGLPPCCTRCGSLERHRALRRFYLGLPIGLLNRRRALQFSPDLSIRPEWFATYEVSVYSGNNSLDLQKIDRPDGAFDFISLNHVIEFVPDAKASFSELVRVLSSDGIIQIGFSQLESRSASLDYDEPQAFHGYYHLFGRDYETYFDLRRRRLHAVSMPLLDDCTGVSETFHFFARELEHLIHLKMYSQIGPDF